MEIVAYLGFAVIVGVFCYVVHKAKVLRYVRSCGMGFAISETENKDKGKNTR